jgi:hypothetical protein
MSDKVTPLNRIRRTAPLPSCDVENSEPFIVAQLADGRMIGRYAIGFGSRDGRFQFIQRFLVRRAGRKTAELDLLWQIESRRHLPMS